MASCQFLSNLRCRNVLSDLGCRTLPRRGGCVGIIALAFLLVALPAFAAIEGTVTNGTTNKPSANDEVVLLELSQGMNEAAHTKTDASGRFKFDMNTDTGGPHLVRVSHQNVNYFKMVPPGMSSGDVTVYESSNRVSGLAYNVETAFQGGSGTLQVVQFYVVRNQSQPARTQTGSGNLDIVLPDNAKIQSADAQAPGGQPIQTAPTPKGKGRYTFDYPLRPGDTTFRIMYEVPYSGDYAFRPALLYPVEQYAVIMPQGMTFKASNAGLFSSQPHQGGVNIAIANNISPSTDLSFRVSGSGQMPDSTASDQGGDSGMGGGQMGGQAQGGRPGGGLGAPIDAPDPLTKYRWPLLLVFAAVLVMGGFYIVKNRQPGPDSPEPAVATVPEPVQLPQRKPAAQQTNGSLLLDAMKEELFQLEIDRHLGAISQDEYTKTKAAYDATLKRALSRQSREAAS